MVPGKVNHLSDVRVLMLCVDLEHVDDCVLTGKHSISDTSQNALFVDYATGINKLSEVLTTPETKVKYIHIDALSCNPLHRIANENLASVLLQNKIPSNIKFIVNGDKMSKYELAGSLLYTFTLT